MNTIFIDNSGRLRSGWRALIFFVLFGLAAFALIGLAVVVIAQFPISESTAAPLRIVIPFAISTVLALVIGWLCGKLLERVPYRALGASFTAGWLKHLGLGWIVGAVSFAIALMAALIAGGIQISINRLSSGADIATTLGSTLVIFAVGAASEETLFRGYLFQTFLRSNHLGFAVALTAFLFASAHGANPDVSALSFINTLIAGVWFAVAYLKTRDLWFPIGIHLAWNWLQGPVFGISVSGIAGFASAPLLRATDNGPVWLTGGDYGIEGGVACTLALVVSIALIWLLPSIRPNEELLQLTSPRQPGS